MKHLIPPIVYFNTLHVVLTDVVNVYQTKLIAYHTGNEVFDGTTGVPITEIHSVAFQLAFTE